MHAIIQLGDGNFYVSAVFGYYADITATDRYERERQANNPYFIVFNKEKTRLIRWSHYVKNTEYIIPQLLIVNADENKWKDFGVRCKFVDFLDRKLIDSFIDNEDQPEDILEKCRVLDAEYIYEEYKEIKTETDIENLLYTVGGFHDAFIAKEELKEDGTLYLLMDGTWGCKIEIWFWGDLEYSTSSRNPDETDLYWYGSTLILQDGFVYFIDETDMTVDEIGPGYCYFKARHMKYKIIPD